LECQGGKVGRRGGRSKWRRRRSRIKRAVKKRRKKDGVRRWWNEREKKGWNVFWVFLSLQSLHQEKEKEIS
jgi:hypothetical protein